VDFRLGSIAEQAANERLSSAIWQEAEQIQSQNWIFVLSASGQKRKFAVCLRTELKQLKRQVAEDPAALATRPSLVTQRV